jgi:hypothetical protein
MHVSPRRMPSRLLLLLALSATVTTFGCGNNATITGTVKYKGNPLKGGNVSFIHSDGTTVGSPIAEDGTYTITKMRAGDVKITVETSTLKPRGGRQGGASQVPAGKEAPGGYMGAGDGGKNYVEIPTKYETPETSGLTYTVKSGKQEHPIDLE